MGLEPGKKVLNNNGSCIIDIYISIKGFATDVCVPISKLPEVLFETKKDLDSSPFTGISIIHNRYMLVMDGSVFVLNCSSYHWSCWGW